MSTVICGNCGAEIVLPEHSELCVGMSISEESKGNYVLSTKNKENKKMTKAEQRMEQLRKSGADMSKYFRFDDTIVKMVNGVPEKVDFDDDPVVEQIITDGYVRNTKLHRRWVLAQMWEMMHAKQWYTQKTLSFDAALQRLGYEYQWRMLVEELRVQMKLEERDLDMFAQRNHFFNKNVVINVCEHYEKMLREYINKVPTKKCKGVPYKRLFGQDIFVVDIDKKIFKNIRSYKREVMYCVGAFDLYTDTLAFYKKCVKKYKLPYKTPMCKEFKEAYKGAGAFYSMMNLFQFHDCKVKVSDYEILAGTKAVDYLIKKLTDNNYKNYMYFGMLKDVIQFNNWTPTWK